jgi:hypothetical protein
MSNGWRSSSTWWATRFTRMVPTISPPVLSAMSRASAAGRIRTVMCAHLSRCVFVLCAQFCLSDSILTNLIWVRRAPTKPTRWWASQSPAQSPHVSSAQSNSTPWSSPHLRARARKAARPITSSLIRVRSTHISSNDSCVAPCVQLSVCLRLRLRLWCAQSGTTCGTRAAGRKRNAISVGQRVLSSGPISWRRSWLTSMRRMRLTLRFGRSQRPRPTMSGN